MSMAMMPAARTFENAASSVFLILPPRVAKTTYLPSVKSRVGEQRAHVLVRLELQQVDDRLAARFDADLGDLRAPSASTCGRAR